MTFNKTTSVTKTFNNLDQAYVTTNISHSLKLRTDFTKKYTSKG